MTTTQTAQTTQVYRVWIKASPEAIWDAITKPEWTDRYGYTGLVEYDLRPGGAFRSVAGPTMEAAGFTGTMVDGEVLEADPPRKLVQTWRMLMDPLGPQVAAGDRRAVAVRRLTATFPPGTTTAPHLCGAVGRCSPVWGAARRRARRAARRRSAPRAGSSSSPCGSGTHGFR